MKSMIGLALMISALCLIAGCSDPSSGEEPKAFYANGLAMDVDTVVFDAAPYNSSGDDNWTATNKIVNGTVSGTAVVNGSYSEGLKSGYTGVYDHRYTGVTIEFNDFCSTYSDYHFTGTVYLSGTLTRYSSSGNYSGSWSITGTVTVTGEADGTAMLNMTHFSIFNGSGTIDFNGTLYDVDF